MKKYLEFKEYVAAELDRQDSDTLAKIDIWVRNAIDRIDRDVQIIAMTRQLTYVLKIGDNSMTLPLDFNHIIQIHNNTDRKAMSAVSVRELMEDIPDTYSMVGGTLMLPSAVTKETTIVMYYRAVAKQLQDPDDTNEYLLLFPQLLKELVIEQAWEYLQSPEKAAQAGQRAVMIIAQIDSQRARAEHKNGSKQRILSNKVNKYF